MTNINSPSKKSNYAVVIGTGSRIIGDIVLEGNALISGAIEGTIKCSGELTIDQSAIVSATIKSDSAKISGRFDGDINCSNKLF